MNQTEMKKRVEFLKQIQLQAIWNVEFPMGIIKGVVEEIEKIEALLKDSEVQS